ncbi:MAG TPA: hypothetical protein VKE97_03345 [Acidimicrobiia bacterium]|nr:hypothetical protein [Acidimicrobiia bacterium]
MGLNHGPSGASTRRRAYGRTYYASWFAACGGSADLLGVILDQWEQDGDFVTSRGLVATAG